jgi:hypothetical protein
MGTVYQARDLMIRDDDQTREMMIKTENDDMARERWIKDVNL